MMSASEQDLSRADVPAEADPGQSRVNVSPWDAGAWQGAWRTAIDTDVLPGRPALKPEVIRHEKCQYKGAALLIPCIRRELHG